MIKDKALKLVNELIAENKALKAALAQPAQEPVAWMHEWADGERMALMHSRDNRFSDQPATVRPLVYGDIAPQQRPWVGLTDEEAQWIYNNGRTPSGMMEMVEAKLKEKNT